MHHFDTARRLLGVLALLAVPALAQAQVLHDTGTIQLEVLGNGFIGGRAELGGGGAGGGAGFLFNGVNGLYEGQFIVGADFEQVSGEAYAGSGTQGPAEWVNLSGPDVIGAPYPTPYEEFDEAYGASYNDDNATSGGAPNPIGLTVVERSYSIQDEDFVVFEFGVTNTSGGLLEDIFIGLFSDLDVGDFAQNLGRYDEDMETVYVWDVTATNPGYYGVTAITADVSGWDLSVGAGTNPTEAQLYTSLSVQSGIEPQTPEDIRTVIGTGPWTIDAGQTAVVLFAYVAGTDEADLLANAEAARDAILSASEGPAEAAGLRLHNAYPNPFQGRTTLTYSLEEPQAARLAVYDALGREVAVLAEGMQTAGTHAVGFDASALANGVYVVRLEAAAASLSQRVMVAN